MLPLLLFDAGPPEYAASQAEQASCQSHQHRGSVSQQERRARQEPPRVQLPSGFHGVSRGEQAAMLMRVISGALRIYLEVADQTRMQTVWRSAILQRPATACGTVVERSN